MSVTSVLPRKNKTLSIIIIIGALILITAAAIFIINKISSNDEPPEWFENYISDVVVLDFDTFSSGDEIPDDMLILFGIWKAVTANPDSAKYRSDKDGNIIIPFADLKKIINDYFVITKQIKPVNADPCRYDAATDSYLVPAYGIEDGCYPKVKKITRPKKGYVMLDVYYYKNTVDYNNDTSAVILEKTVLITLKGEPGKYKILSLIDKS